MHIIFEKDVFSMFFLSTALSTIPPDTRRNLRFNSELRWGPKDYGAQERT